MAKRSNYEWIGERLEEDELDFIEDELKLDPVKEVEVATTTPLVLTTDVILNITGKVTGIAYRFEGAGSIVNVDTRDAEIMLKKRTGNSCCPGSSGSSSYFEIVR
ncbi:MAG: hypothetical protein KKH61_20755 [Gammaproteobacteria bacterium]|nr:hypothetical protein [Gammaproteobacteria bacterium]